MKVFIVSAFAFLLTLTAKAQMFGGKFEQGYYYDINGQKVEGLINENTSGKGPVPYEGYIIFKEAEKAPKQNLSASMIHGYVIGKDSFVVAHSPRNGAWSKYELDFLRVVVNAPTKLYTINGSDHSGGGGGGRPSVSTGFGVGGGIGSGVGLGLSLGSGLFGGGGSSHSVYYYGTETNNMAEVNKQNFIDVMSEVLGDEPDAVEKVKNRKYKIGDMDALIKYYNTLREEHKQ